MNLRRKLLLVALCTLALPVAGWLYVRQMEALLRDGQAQALLASAGAVARSLVVTRAVSPQSARGWYVQAAPGPITVTEPAERDLVLLLDAFDQALVDAYDKKAPNFLAEHAYKLAQAFSKFYAACPFLQAEAPVRSSRLALAQATLRQLEQVLELLGIEAPERM